MNVRFRNGETQKCTLPTEQKLFRDGENAGWILSFSIKESVTSDKLDELLSEENISTLEFSDDENEICSLSGYQKATSVIIRYAVSAEGSRADIQLIKSQ